MREENCKNCQHWGSVIEKVLSNEPIKYCWIKDNFTEHNHSCNLFFPVPEEEIENGK
jgi:hypothetical protein